MTKFRSLQYVFLACVIFAVFQAAGCSRDEPAPSQNASAPANDYCPIMGGEVDPKVTTTWDGKTVAFCCEPCLPKWKKLSDDEKARNLANPPKEK